MFNELIRSITQTEAQAAEILREAQEEEGRIVAEAQALGLQLMEQAGREASRRAELIVRQAEEDAGAKAQKLRGQMLEECTRIRLEAAEKMEQAAAEMMERIVNSYGNR